MEEYRCITLRILSNTIQPEIAKDVEISAFNKAIDSCSKRGVSCSWENPRFIESYRASALYVVRNSAEIAKLVSEHHIEAKSAAYTTPFDLNPGRWADLLESQRIRNEARGSKPQATTDMFTCPKCHARQTTYAEAQTRSADEPMTLFISCVVCGHAWRM